MKKEYIYDTHIHTVEVSPCGHIHAAETVDYYAAHGYSGLIITDHLHQEFLDKVGQDRGWDVIVDHYMAGYRSAKKRGDEIGFDVLFGAEMRFKENDNDYLVYNIDESWLRAHPWCICQTAPEFFAKFHDEVLFIQAHPYRNGNLTVYEDSLHGVELINANPRHNNYLDRARSLCERHPEYYIQAGSDMHKTEDRCHAGIITEHRITNSFEYADLIRSGQYDLYAPEFSEYVEAFHEMRKQK